MWQFTWTGGTYTGRTERQWSTSEYISKWLAQLTTKAEPNNRSGVDPGPSHPQSHADDSKRQTKIFFTVHAIVEQSELGSFGPKRTDDNLIERKTSDCSKASNLINRTALHLVLLKLILNIFTTIWQFSSVINAIWYKRKACYADDRQK